MGMPSFLEASLGGLLASLPALVVWIIVLVITITLTKRGGGRAEKFLVTGAALGIVSSLALAFAVAFMPSLVSSGGSIDRAAAIINMAGIARDIIGAAGLICFIYAYWVKFNKKAGLAQKQAAARLP